MESSSRIEATATDRLGIVVLQCCAQDALVVSNPGDDAGDLKTAKHLDRCVRQSRIPHHLRQPGVLPSRAATSINALKKASLLSNRL
jgi:hypothetical protein